MSWIDWAIGWLHRQNMEDASKRAAEAARLQAEAFQQQTDQMRQTLGIPTIAANLGGAGGAGGGSAVFRAGPQHLWMDTPRHIENEAIFLTRGLGPWIADRGQVVDADENLGLPRRLYRLPFHRMSITVMHVYNHTLEPDGSRKEYWLQVPDEATTAAAAVALSFGINPQFYREAVAS